MFASNGRKLDLQEFGTHLYNITPNLGCLMTGMSPDARALVYRHGCWNRICLPGLFYPVVICRVIRPVSLQGP